MSQPADIILTNGKVFTLSQTVWASAVAIRDGRFVYVGSDDEVEDYIGPNTEQIDLEGRTVIPGLIDSHVHLLYYGRNKLLRADLNGCKSIKEIIQRLQAHDEKRRGEWILGWGFDQEILAERRFPTRHDLDQFNKPVLISRLCGHACVVNSKAIELVGPEKIPDSARDTGLLTEDDMNPVWEAMPQPTFKEMVEAAEFAAAKALATGLTSVHCLVSSQTELDAVRHINRQSQLPIRFYVQPGYEMLDSLLAEGLKTGDGDEMLRMGAIKIFADGSMGARTAALKEDFADDPGNNGILLHSDEELTDMVRKVHNSGWQVAIHAIGDRAVEQAVNAIETVLIETGEDNRTRRHRIEHASLLNEDLVFRMADLHILASVQPQFIITDFWTINRVGRERYRWAYPFRTMLEAGIPLSLGSDCPVENLDVFELICRAVTRDEHSQSERLTVEETIALYSLGGAYAMFQEANLGSIEVGKLADFIVLNQDIFSIPESEIPNCKVETVFVGGKRKI
ncbi:MAG: amidohydrolase [Armatimonadota bacterium]|nr:amidohydrolase [Armatimonadota bacterium]